LLPRFRPIGFWAWYHCLPGRKHKGTFPFGHAAEGILPIHLNTNDALNNFALCKLCDSDAVESQTLSVLGALPPTCCFYICGFYKFGIGGGKYAPLMIHSG
jgi:hypothetical protein